MNLSFAHMTIMTSEINSLRFPLNRTEHADYTVLFHTKTDILGLLQKSLNIRLLVLTFVSGANVCN